MTRTRRHPSLPPAAILGRAGRLALAVYMEPQINKKVSLIKADKFLKNLTLSGNISCEPSWAPFGWRHGRQLTLLVRQRWDHPGLGNDTQTPKGRSFHKALRTSFFPWASGGADLFLMQREPALTAFGRALGGVCLAGVESFPETAVQFSFASVSQAQGRASKAPHGSML